ncbi:MAG TPA: hypothetical protein VHE12_11830 [bacterium]|nr:hypothetical protein [bacterium]
METLPSGTPLDPQSDPSLSRGKEAARMNIDISARKPGEKFLYTGPHLCVTCAGEDRIMNRHFTAGETAPECPHCGPRALWEP